MSDSNKDYSDLKRQVAAAGLFKKQPMYYVYKIFFTLALFVLGIAILIMVDNIWLQVINAVFIAFVFTQIGLIGHDAGHRQIARSVARNDAIGLVVSFLLGISRSWWVDKHNLHHGNPNDLDLDPDINIPGIAFTEEQARAKKGILRFLGKYQAFYFLPLLCLEGLGVRIASVQYLIQGKRIKYTRLEPLIIIAHIALYVGLVFFFLSFWQGIIFVILHQAVFGLYLGSVFAPNHKGMMMVDKDSNLSYLEQQVLTARNVKGHPLIDFMYGGLNYQIEHHLFPNIPRNKLKEVQKIVRPFCQNHSIPYCETGYLQSWKEILGSLHEASAPLRNKTPQKVQS